MSKFASKYDKRDRVPFVSLAPSLTQQQFAQEADVNVLIARYKQTGSFYNPLSLIGKEPRRPMYEDLAVLPDLQVSLATLQGAQDIFMSLPARVREQFGNDVAQFVAWAQDVRNLPALAELGVVDGVPSPTPQGAAESGDQPAAAVEPHKPAAVEDGGKAAKAAAL